MMTKRHRINDMAFGDLRPEKAGVGGSIPSLATTSFPDIRHLGRAGLSAERNKFLHCRCGSELRFKSREVGGWIY